jgi:hypothetical protein
VVLQIMKEKLTFEEYLPIVVVLVILATAVVA